MAKTMGLWLRKYPIEGFACKVTHDHEIASDLHKKKILFARNNLTNKLVAYFKVKVITTWNRNIIKISLLKTVKFWSFVGYFNF